MNTTYMRWLQRHNEAEAFHYRWDKMICPVCDQTVSPKRMMTGLDRLSGPIHQKCYSQWLTLRGVQ